MILLWFIVMPIILGLFGYLINRKWTHFLIILAQMVLFVLAIYQFFQVNSYGTIIYSLGYQNRFYTINLIADQISILFVLLAIFLFTMMLIYNYHKHYMNHLFLFLFIILEGLINGLFLSSDLFDLYTLIEVATVNVAVLIMFKKDSQSIYDGIVYLLTNLVSMTLFLLGIGYLYRIFGNMDFTIIKSMMPLVKKPETLIIPCALLTTSIGLKSAIMPLFSWLPRAHGTPSAPSIVSAILSGLYVKGGLYLFIRLQDTFSYHMDTRFVFLIMGFLTAVVGFIYALSQTDIKLILAYHTVSQIGLIIFGLSIGTDYSYYGSIYHVVNHAIFKSTLFLTAGIIIEEYHTRDIRKIHGVFQRMPYVAVIMMVAIFGITGAPLFNGSVSKYMIQKGSSYSDLLEMAMIVINFGTIASFVKYATMLLGQHEDRYKVRWNQKIALGILAGITFIGGTFGQYFVNWYFHLHIDIDLQSWLSKTGVYLLSLTAGILFYRYAYKRIHFFTTMREIELTFNEVVYSIIFFFTGYLSYLMINFRG